MKRIKRFSVLAFSLFLFSAIALLSFNVRAANLAEADVRDEDGNYIGRQFDEQYDLLYEDFNRSTITGIAGTGLKSATNEDSDVYVTDYHLVAKYSNTVGTTKDAPIYKVASPLNSEGAFQYLVFEMSGSDGASIEDLILSFRYDDNHHDLDVPFDELYGPDFEALPELTDDYQTYVIDVTSSLDGKEFVSIEDETITVDASSALAGFHFMSDPNGEGEGTLKIKRVYWSKTPNPTFNASDNNYALLDQFDREKLDQGGENIWWRGGSPDSQIVGKWLAFDFESKQAVYQSIGSENTNADGTYKNVVLKIKALQDEADLYITPIYENDELGAKKALSTLLGPDSEVVPALTKNFQNIVINFAVNEWDDEVIGFRFESKEDTTGTIYIDDIFFTNMEYDASSIDRYYPVLDAEDILLFDDFNRDKLGATADYDANNPVALENDLLFIIGYAGIDRMSIEDGALVFDATENSDYMQYTTASIHENDGSYQYVVFKVKGTDGASLNNFRIQTIDTNDNRSEVVWANGGLKSGNQLPTAQFDTEDYLYVTSDGYIYLIVDLVASNLTETVRGFDLFYSGTGKLYIDSIFFANKGSVILNEEEIVVFDDFNRDVLAPEDPSSVNKYWFDTNANVEDNALVLDATGNEYAYYRTASSINNADQPKRYIRLVMKGSEGTTLESFRMETFKGSDSSEIRFYNAGHLVGAPGYELPELTTEYQTYIIDLEASGLIVDAEGVGLFFGGWDSGQLYIDEVSFIDSIADADFVDLIEERLEELSELRHEEPEEPEDPEDPEEPEEPEDPEEPEQPKDPEEPKDSKDKSGLSGLEITLIVIGAVAVIVGIGTVIYIKKR